MLSCTYKYTDCTASKGVRVCSIELSMQLTAIQALYKDEVFCLAFEAGKSICTDNTDSDIHVSYQSAHVFLDDTFNNVFDIDKASVFIRLQSNLNVSQYGSYNFSFKDGLSLDRDYYLSIVKTARDYRSRDRYAFDGMSLNPLFCVNNNFLNQGRFLGDAMESNDGSRFYQKAMDSIYARTGRSRIDFKTHFKLPEHIQKRLDRINASADDSFVPVSASDAHQNSRFYHKAAAIKEMRKMQETRKDKFIRNTKIWFVVLLGFAAYYYYVENYRDKIDSVEDMIASLPITLDEYTTLTHIDDKEHEFVMTIVKDGDLYANVDAQKREESLDRIVKNAQNLCANPLIGSIVSSGRKVTVLLQSDDNSFERTINIDSCKRKTSAQ